MTGRHGTRVNSWDFSTMANLPLDSCTVPVNFPVTVSPSAAARNGSVFFAANSLLRICFVREAPERAIGSDRRAGKKGVVGFTGGHFHRNWGIEAQRTLVLNAILWTAKAEVPAGGVPSKVTEEELKANLDKKR